MSVMNIRAASGWVSDAAPMRVVRLAEHSSKDYLRRTSTPSRLVVSVILAPPDTGRSVGRALLSNDESDRQGKKCSRDDVDDS